MSLRFRRSVRLFPGVRLNFSGGGISTTVGVRGASVTLGPRGSYLNLGAPGTGVSYRTRLTPTAAAGVSGVNPEAALRQAPAPVLERPGPDARQIASADVSALTTGGLSELKRLINEASTKRRDLVLEVEASRRRLEDATRRLRFAQRFIVRIFTRRATPRLQAEVDSRQSALDEVLAELDGCYVDVDFDFDVSTHGTYAALLRSFEDVAACEKIWDVTSIATTNRVAERTVATHAFSRTPVQFDFAAPEIVKTPDRAMRLTEATGRHIYLYPGFLMMRDPSSDFALVEYSELEVAFSPSRFIEEEATPADAEVIGQTWKKANKDGSPDRRFANNYAIPIVKYAELAFGSATGLNEAYQFSSFERAAAFARALENHRRALQTLVQRRAQGDDLPQPPPVGEEEPADPTEPSRASAKVEGPPSLVADWIVLLLLILMVAGAGRWLVRHQADPLAPVEPPKVKQTPDAVAPPAKVKRRRRVHATTPRSAEPASPAQPAGRSESATLTAEPSAPVPVARPEEPPF